MSFTYPLYSTQLDGTLRLLTGIGQDQLVCIDSLQQEINPIYPSNLIRSGPVGVFCLLSSAVCHSRSTHPSGTLESFFRFVPTCLWTGGRWTPADETTEINNASGINPKTAIGIILSASFHTSFLPLPAICAGRISSHSNGSTCRGLRL